MASAALTRTKRLVSSREESSPEVRNRHLFTEEVEG